MSDVFISYSSKDGAVAERLCMQLEQRGISCWIAPRNIIAGDEWATAITTAIGAAKVFLIIYSENSAHSTQVPKEINLANNRNLYIIPYKIDGMALINEFEYYLSNSHWIQANPSENDMKIDELCDIIASKISSPVSKAAVRDNTAESKPVNVQKESKPAKWLVPLIICATVAIAAVAVAVAVIVGSGSSSNQSSGSSVIASETSAVVQTSETESETSATQTESTTAESSAVQTTAFSAADVPTEYPYHTIYETDCTAANPDFKLETSADSLTRLDDGSYKYQGDYIYFGQFYITYFEETTEVVLPVSVGGKSNYGLASDHCVIITDENGKEYRYGNEKSYVLKCGQTGNIGGYFDPGIKIVSVKYHGMTLLNEDGTVKAEAGDINFDVSENRVIRTQ